MSSYEDSYREGRGETTAGAAVPPSFREEYPALATIFAGITGEDGKTCSVPAATVNLWFEAGTCKFCIMPRFGNRIAFGTIASPEKGFAALEEAIQRGHYEWKVSKRRNSA
jgi:hypothetical protein